MHVSMAPLKPQIGDVLRRARLNAGFTQEQLAERIGCSPGKVGQWETGEVQKLDWLTIHRWLNACGYEMDDLLSAVGDPQSGWTHAQARRNLLEGYGDCYPFPLEGDKLTEGIAA